MGPLLYVIAGEPSGDLHGGHLLSALKALHPSIHFKGVGGACLINAGLKPVLSFDTLQVMGFTEVCKKLPMLYRSFQDLTQKILIEKPEGVLTIDYPGFNLRLAKRLRKEGFQGKLIHYIAPSVWAWKSERAQEMARFYDLLLTTLPFEKAWFSRTSLETVYVGNPVVEEFFNAKETDFALNGELLAIFPGSRQGEIKKHLPLFLACAKTWLKAHPHARAVIATDPLFHPLIQSEIEHKNLSPDYYFLTSHEHRFSLMNKAKAALCKSGTVSLELALRSCPSVVCYNMSSINHFLARYLFKINLPFYALPNIILQKQLFPEHYGCRLNPLEILDSLNKVSEKKEEVERGKKELIQKLGRDFPSLLGAKHLHRLLCL